MCGIAGLLDTSMDSLPTVEGMLARLSHRGPNDGGTWFDPTCGIALGHRRLSIVDLSPAGHQPMVSANGRFVLTYNGEVYNHIELRASITQARPGSVWRGTSDTEVLLAAIDEWGLSGALHRINGMFAFALWDRQRRTLTLARDRMGEKPMYFGWVANHFAFASELKAFAALSGWHPHLHPAAVAGFLRTGYVHGTQSAISGIYRLPPGCLLELSLADIQQRQDWPWLMARLDAYWSLGDVAMDGLTNPVADVGEATHQLDLLLRDATRSRMVADVPLGAFLSGGIDSSLITALMQAHSRRPVRTFSIGFNSASHDEAPYARAVAKHLGTEHTELYVDAEAALELIPTLAERFDEPFADVSQLPTLLVSRLARQHVTVALSGDGGDELFAGYSRYFAIAGLWRALKLLPAPLGSIAATACRLAAKAARPIAGGQHPAGPLPFRLTRLAERLDSTDLESMRLSFIGGAGHARIMRNRQAADPLVRVPPGITDPLRRLMYADQVDYLPDDILCKVDRAAMAYSLETRIPLLDHRIVELSWRFPRTALANRRYGKLPLRNLLDQHVPRSLIDRPKQGFAPPMDAWLRGPLRGWAETRLAQTSLRELPMLDSQAVRDIWKAHCDGHMNAAGVLWNVLMLADWRERFEVRY